MEKDKINFLPWREAYQERQRKKLNRMVMISALIFMAFQCVIYINYRMELNIQSQQLEQLERQKQALQQKAKWQQQLQAEKTHLSENIKQLSQLYRDQSATTFLLNTLSSIIPTGLVLEEIKKRDKDIYLTGISNNARLVSQFTDELEKNTYLVHPQVILIRRSETDSDRHRFELSFSLSLLVDSGKMVIATKGKVE